MVKLTTRQCEAIQSLTDRQLEALSLAATGKSARSRFGAPSGTRSNMGGAANRMLEHLTAAGLLDRDGITFAGVEGVLLNIARVPLQHRETVKAEAARLKPDLERKADEAELERERKRVAGEQRRQYRQEARAHVIPSRWADLTEQVGAEALEDALGRTSNEKLVALWDAIVNADAAL